MMSSFRHHALAAALSIVLLTTQAATMDQDLSSYRWEKRIITIEAKSSAGPRLPAPGGSPDGRIRRTA